METEIPKLIPGWEGKAKGILRVLWEQGLLDGSKLNSYTLDGKKDLHGVLRPETSLKHLLGSCTDFAHEESLLQTIGKRMGVMVECMPKCHCELVGGGIEYAWACSKNAYHQMLLSQKWKKEMFRNTVRLCWSRNILTVE